MSRKRFTEEQIIGFLKRAEAGERHQNLCREYGISEATYYKWKNKFGGMEVSDAKTTLRHLEGREQALKAHRSGSNAR